MCHLNNLKKRIASESTSLLVPKFSLGGSKREKNEREKVKIALRATIKKNL